MVEMHLGKQYAAQDEVCYFKHKNVKRPDPWPRTTLLPLVTAHVARKSGGSQSKRCPLRVTHFPRINISFSGRLMEKLQAWWFKESEPRSVLRQPLSENDKVNTTTSRRYVSFSSPMTASQSRIVWSLEADATVCPSGEKATTLTED
jgi:hypothetical protein